MSTADTEKKDVVGDDEAVVVDEAAQDSGDADEATKPERLKLEVQVDQPSTCERHVTVVVPREEIDRYMEREFDDLLPKAQVPGFRAGRAPRKLVVSRFKEQTEDQVKGKLLMDSMTQISEEYEFSAISEPDLKVEAIVMPEEGPLTFEFTLEVRPEFDLPEWKGLTITRPVVQVTDEDVQRQLEQLLARFGKLVDSSEPITEGDFATVNITFSHDGASLSELKEYTLAVKPKLSFRDAELDRFGEIAIGANKGDTKQFKVQLSAEIDNEQVAGKEVDATMEILNVERLELPKLTPSFLNEIGGFQSEDDLKDAVREELERQNTYRQLRHMRQQITDHLTATATWDLPQGLLRRQANRELKRAVLELQSAGFSADMIQAHANRLQQNVLASTQRALKEHFILERIAEENGIDAKPEDFDREIERIAEQNDLSPRRVRARLEKQGEMDSLRNQIVERRVIELITEHATVNDTSIAPDVDDTTAIDHAIAGAVESKNIPEATSKGEAASLPNTVDHS